MTWWAAIAWGAGSIFAGVVVWSLFVALVERPGFWRSYARQRFRYTIAFFGELGSVAAVIFTVVGLVILAANVWWGASCLVSAGSALGCR